MLTDAASYQHNYARWYCAIIGQPELSFLNPSINVTDDHFVDLWVKLAERYANNTNVIFQLMNERKSSRYRIIN